MTERTFIQEVMARSEGWHHIDGCPVMSCTCGMLEFMNSLEAEASLKLEPAYYITTRVNDKTVHFREPIADPFISCTIDIKRRGLIKYFFKRRGLTINVGVDGNKDAHFKVFRGDRISNGDNARTSG